MAGLRALFVQRDGSNNGTVPKGARLALGGLLAPGTTDPLSVRTGVLVDGMGPVVVGTGSMAYQVRPFVGVTKYSDSNGPTVAANDGPVTVTTTPAPGSNSRIDRVWMIQRLVTGDGGAGTTNVFEFGVTQGNVAASPTPPTSIPAGAVPLMDFTVTAGAASTASLTATRRHEWTVANGGVIPLDKYTGLVWDGAAWKRTPIGAYPVRMLYRTATMSIGAGATPVVAGWGRSDGDDGDESGIVYGSGALTAPVAGLYRVKATVLWPSMSSGNRLAGIQRSTNGGSTWTEWAFANTPTGGIGTSDFERRVQLAAGEMVRMYVAQSSGSTVTVAAGANTVFELELVRPV